MTIDDWRRRIDELDRKLVELLNERSHCALEIGRIKHEAGLPVYQPDREKEVLANAERHNQGPLPGAAIRRLFERIVDEARSVERHAMLSDPSRGRKEIWRRYLAPTFAFAKFEFRSLEKSDVGRNQSMVVVMQEGSSDEQIQHVIDRLTALGFDVHRSTGESHTVLGAVGVKADFDSRSLELIEGVREVVRITQPYKLVSRAFRPAGNNRRIAARRKNRRPRSCRRSRTLRGGIQRAD